MQNTKLLMRTAVLLILVTMGFSSLQAQPGDNIITNGDFTSGLDNWDFELPGGSSVATADASTGELYVDIILDSGTNWHIRLFQKGITLETGKEYTFSFDARADSARDIIAKVQKDQAPTTSSLHQKIAITDSMQNYSVTWTNEVETATYKAGFFLGADTFDVWVDNVQLTGEASSDVEDAENVLPLYTELMHNYPNPFNPTTTIPYQLSRPTQVKIMIFNSFGQRVSTLVNKKQPAGYYSVKWRGKNDNGRQVASGLYIYRLETNNSVQMKKFMLLR